MTLPWAALGLLLIGFAAGSSETPEPVAAPAADRCAERLTGDSAPPVWQAMLDRLEARASGMSHPFEAAGFDADAIGRIQLRFRQALPGYAKLFPVKLPDPFTREAYEAMRRGVWSSLEAVLADERARPEALFAAIEAIRRLTVLEAIAPLPPVVPVPDDPRQDESPSDETSAEDPDQDGRRACESGSCDRGGGPPQSGGEQSGEGEPSASGQPREENPWTAPSERYVPENKRLKEEKGRKEPVIYRTDALVPERLLPDSYYDVITATHLASNRFIRPRPRVERPPRKIGVARLSPLGARTIRLAAPYGAMLTAQRKKGHEAVPLGPGEWELRLSENEEEVELDLFADDAISLHLPATDEAVYAASSGIPADLWPEKIRDFLKDLRKKSLSREAAAEELKNFLRRPDVLRYYSETKKVPASDLDAADKIVRDLEGKGYPRPVAFAHAGLVNCDGAGWIYALLAKDFLSIPVRIAHGRTVSSRWREKGVTWQQVRKGTPRHGWVEVWTGSRWRPFDPTPETELGTGESESEGEAGDGGGEEGGGSGDGADRGGDSRDGAVESSAERSGGEAGAGEGRGRRELGEESRGSEGDAGTEGSGDRRSREKARPSEGGEGDSEGSGSTERASSDDPPGGREISPRLHLLNEAPAEGSPPQRRELLRAVAETVELFALETALQRGGGQAALARAIRLLARWAEGDANRGEAVSPSVQRLAEARDAVGESPLPARLAETRLAVAEGKFREAWWDIRALDRLILAIAARRPLAPLEEKFATQLRLCLSLFDGIKHADAGKYDLADWVLTNLPGALSRRWVRDQYGDVLRLGSAALDKFVADIGSGALGPLVRMAFLSEFSRMVSTYIPEPAWDEQVLLERNTVPHRRIDEIVLARSPLELPRMLLNPRPGEPFWAPLFQRRQFALGSRRRVPIAAPNRTLDRKLSVVFFDVSGSMGGLPIMIQNDLLAVFLDKALSEVDRMGNPLHEVILIPFNDGVLEGRRVRTVAEAMAFISERIADRLPYSAGGGTDIQAALLKFYDSVADSYHNPDPVNRNRRLRHASMVLFSDGGSPVNLQTVLDARNQIPEEVRLYLNFVGIGSSNPTVEELARTSGISTRLPLVRVIPVEEMNRIHGMSRLVPADDRFATELGAFQAPPELVLALNRLGERPLASVDFVSWLSERDLERALVGLSAAISGAPPPECDAMLGDIAALVAAGREIGVDVELRRKLLFAVLVAYPSASRRSSGWFDREREAIREVERWMRDP